VTYSYTLTDAARQLNKAKASGRAVALQKSAKITGHYTSAFSDGGFTVTPNDGTVPEITQISPFSRNLFAAGGTYSVDVRTTGQWTVEIPAGATWVTYEVTQGGLVETAPADPTTGQAGAAVVSTTVGSGNGTVTLTVAPWAPGTSGLPWTPREAKIKVAGVTHTIKQDYREQ
jgi:type II secretory pathway pseudopilin PulG